MILGTVGRLGDDIAALTRICVIHEVGFAQQVAERVIFMVLGEVIEEAGPPVFSRNPQHQRTRNLLGQVLNEH